MLTCTQATHTHTNTWHSIGLPLHLKHNSTTTNLLKNKRENKKTQSHNPVYRLSRPCAGPHSWLNDDNRNNYTHTHNAGLLPPPSPPPPPAQTVWGWGSKWRHGLLLSKQQKTSEHRRQSEHRGAVWHNQAASLHHPALSPPLPCIDTHTATTTEGTQKVQRETPDSTAHTGHSAGLCFGATRWQDKE